MAKDRTRQLRAAVIDRLKSAATASVPAERWYPQQIPAAPTWPYGFCGVPIATPDRADCMDGSIVRFAVHGYARTGGIVSGETQANMIGEDISAALDGWHVALDDATADLTWISSTTIRDGNETSQFHVIVQMQAEITA